MAGSGDAAPPVRAPQLLGSRSSVSRRCGERKESRRPGGRCGLSLHTSGSAAEATAVAFARGPTRVAAISPTPAAAVAAAATPCSSEAVSVSCGGSCHGPLIAAPGAVLPPTFAPDSVATPPPRKPPLPKPCSPPLPPLLTPSSFPPISLCSSYSTCQRESRSHACRKRKPHSGRKGKQSSTSRSASDACASAPPAQRTPQLRPNGSWRSHAATLPCRASHRSKRRSRYECSGRKSGLSRLVAPLGCERWRMEK
mmetsp:Transcript_60978/g.161561  ORF Transcript_60978/g.161561 Transcript_60978/m.161561 type:complete len:254 (+) Transcript_60978:797-1558(+)